MPRLARALSVLNRRRDHGEIGLELSLEELHMVQLCRVGESLQVVGHVSVGYDSDLSTLLANPDAFIGVVKQGLKQGNFAGRKAVIAMPSSLTQVMPVSYQTSDRLNDDAAIAELMHERLGEGVAEFVIDYMPVQTLYEGKQKLALVAICREETVVNLLELLRKAGLHVSALEIGPIALRRLITTLQPKGTLQNTLVVNCGRDKSYLTLLSDNRLLADDEVDFGEEQVLQKISSTLDMHRDIVLDLVHKIGLNPNHKSVEPGTVQNAEALSQIVKPLFARLAQEIERGLVFAQSESRGSRPNQVYLLGSIARWHGAAELLSDLVQAPVATAPSPLALFASSSTKGLEPAPELAVATGLALRKFMQHG